MKQILILTLALTLAACSPARAVVRKGNTDVTFSPTPHPTQEPTATPADTYGELSRCTVTATALHIRSGAGIEHPVIGYLYAGDIVTIESQRGAWYDIGAGWIHSKIL
jgi:uncharacterized protein YgiM (DUF1202 family)